MKIGQFCDTFLPIVDGVGRVVYSYADTLGKMGHESYVITPMANTGYRGRLNFEIVDFHGTPLPGMPQYRAGMPLADQHYHARMEMIDLDLVHIHSPFIAGQEGLRIAKRRQIPVVATFHSKFYDDFKLITGSAPLAEAGVKYVVAFFERCDEVWAVSQASADTLNGYGFKREIIVMPNGTQLRQADPAAVAKVRADYAPDGRPILLFVGQINVKKNIPMILDAAALLSKSGQPFTLLLAGQGPHLQQLTEQAESLGISDRVHFVGHITDTTLLDALYAAASLFVFPSLYDNAPMVVREAAAVCTPSVVARHSTTAEIIHDGENGFLCEDTADDLCAVIKKALSDSEELETVGQAAHDTIPLRWEDILGRAADRYRRLIASSM